MFLTSVGTRLLFATTLLFSALWLWERFLRVREREVARELRDTLGQDLVKVIRNQRHGFINHLQVISGWLQLKKPDHVFEYIDGIRRKREQESQILRVKSVEVLGLLLVKSSLAEANELDIRWEVEGALAQPPALWVEALGTVLENLITALARLGGEPQLLVQLSETEAAVFFRVAIGTGLGLVLKDADLTGFTDLAARVRSAGGRWVEQLAPTYALELSMPAKPAGFRHTRAG
ncbi:MAG: Spo0B domain-containing protein [Symbiobacteriia bacterium]